MGGQKQDKQRTGDEAKTTPLPDRTRSTSTPWWSSNSSRLADLDSDLSIDDAGRRCVVPSVFDTHNPLQSHGPLFTDDDFWRYRLGEASAPFDHVAHVLAPRGVRLRDRPAPGAEDQGILPFDTRVHIQRKTSYGWCYVTVLAQEAGVGSSEITGASGFIEGRFLLLDPPDNGSFLHLVMPGERAGQVSAEYFMPPGGFETGDDNWVFVSALWEVNKSGLQTAEGPYPTAMIEKPVSLHWYQTWPRTGSEEQSLRQYLGARLRAGGALWIPSLEKVRDLRSSNVITSAAILGSSGEEGGFLRGLYDGIAAEIKNMADLLFQIFFENDLVEKFIDAAKRIGELITKLDAKQLMAAGKSAVLDFMAKWNDPDPFMRGHFQGKIVGHLIVFILPMILTEGASAGAEGAELAASVTRTAGGAVDALDAIDTTEVITGLKRDLEAGNVADRLLATYNFLDRTGIVAEPFEGGFEAIEEHFNEILDDLFPDDDPWGGFYYRAEEGQKGTMFDPAERTINFSMDRSMNKFTVAEEVQHAIDYTEGATSKELIAAQAKKLGIPKNQIGNWWHRRVFTRLIKNIAEEKYGFGYLKPRLDEVYKLYQRIGGKMPLDEILSSDWKSLFQG